MKITMPARKQKLLPNKKGTLYYHWMSATEAVKLNEEKKLTDNEWAITNK